MKRIVYLIMLVCLLPYYAFTQKTELPNKPIKNVNVKKALNYINEQFKEYNAYNMQWGVDETNKILVSKSKYFRVEYPLASISSFKYKNEIVTLTCSDDECITSLDLDYNTTSTKSSNTVNLTSGNTIGEKVIEAFYTIQSELTGIDVSNISSTDLPNKPIKNAKVKEALNFINEQFKEFNAYNMQWGVDETNKILVSKSKYFRVEYPLASIESFSYENKIVKLECSGDDCITSLDLEYNSSTKKTSNTVNLTSNGVIGQKVVDAFYTIQSELTGGKNISNNQTLSANVKKALEYINEQFAEYNAYNMQWSIDGSKKAIISTSKYYKITYPLSSIETIKYIAGDQVMEFTCKDEDNCISLYDLDNYNTSTKSTNRANLTCGSSIGNKVTEAFLTIQSELTGSSNIKTSNGNNAKVDEAMEFINTQFEIYNKYDVQFWIEKDKGNLKSKSKYFEVTYPIKSLKKIVLYKRDVKDYLVEFYCKNGDCIKSKDIETDDVSYQSEYSVNLPCSQSIGDQVIESFETIVKEYGGKLVQDDE